MPDAVGASAEQNGRFFFFLQLLVGAAIVFLGILYKPLLLDKLSSGIGQPIRSSAEGLIAGLILILSRYTYVRRRSFRVNMLLQHPFARGPLAVWLLTFVAAGVLEEIWRACCIVSAQEGQFGAIASVIGTSLAFTFAHLAGIPSRMVGIREEVFWEFLFGIALGTLFVQLGNLVVPLVAGLLLNSFNLILVRRMTRRVEHP